MIPLEILDIVHNFFKNGGKRAPNDINPLGANYKTRAALFLVRRTRPDAARYRASAVPLLRQEALPAGMRQSGSDRVTVLAHCLARIVPDVLTIA